MKSSLKGCFLVFLVAFSSITPLLAAGSYRLEQRKINGQPDRLNRISQPQRKEVEVSVEEASGFQWGNMAGMALKLLVGGQSSGPRGDRIAQLADGEMTWTKGISLAMELILALIGGEDYNKIDRQDVLSSPLENILTAIIAYFTGSGDNQEVALLARQTSELMGLAMSLLDALRTSFSQRSLEARSIGSSDTFADITTAAAALTKGLILSSSTGDEFCQQKRVCEANRECAIDASDSGYLFCQMGTYGLGALLEKATYISMESFNEAGRRGRLGDSCEAIYEMCNYI